MSKVYFLPSQEGNEIFARSQSVANKFQRLQKSNQQPLLFIAFSIICTLTTIGFGSHFFLKLKVVEENLSSQLTSMETNNKAMEETINELTEDNKDLSSQLTSMTKKLENNKLTIEKSVDEKIRALEKITMKTFRNLTDDVQRLHQGLENQILHLAKNISKIVTWIHAKEEEDKAYPRVEDRRVTEKLKFDKIH